MTKINRARVLELRAQGLKFCTGCEQELPLSGFHVNRRNQDGRQSRCRECQCSARNQYRTENPELERERARAYREANPELERERRRKYHAENPISERLRCGKNRARRRGLPADEITPEELHQHWQVQGIQPDRCIYCPGPFEHLDHILPISLGGGHTIDNLIPSCEHCNLKKKNTPLIDFLADRAEAAKEAAA
ncbi:HNH endonuclease [Prescottella equi]